MAVNLTSQRSLKGWGWKSATRSSSHSQIYCQGLQSYAQDRASPDIDACVFASAAHLTTTTN